mmetsp:Transcript_17023/g.19011  ORF Transcript_17023/g.19011 Transcript_17023/m.19011 type:complete len:305 (-) Transcript_17023:237-1151(-)
MFSMPAGDPYDLPAVTSARDSKLEKPKNKRISRSISHKLKSKEERKLLTSPGSKWFKDPSNSRIEDHKTIGNWAKTFLPLIQKGNKSDKLLKGAVYDGIPQELREVVWFQLIGNIHQDYTPLYHQLLDLRESIKTKDIYRKNEKLIDKDLHRTFTTLDLFKPGNILHEPLRNVLTAFIVHRPDIGYVQGMSYLAGVLLMNLDEIHAFSLFLSLSNWDILYYCFCFNMDKVNSFFSMFTNLLKIYTPYVSEILEEENIAVSLFLFEWIITMFSSTFPTTVCFRIWDQVLFNGQIEIIKFSLAILK